MTEPEPFDDLLLFTPVPMLRRHARGWSSDVQIAFIQALARCGVVAAAARSVGRSPRSAYQLRDRPGAESFAAAWDEAIDRGLDEMRSLAIQRVHNPERVPIVWRGEIVGWRERFDNRLCIAALRAFDRVRAQPRRPLEHQLRIEHRAAMAAMEASERSYKAANKATLEADRAAAAAAEKAAAIAAPRAAPPAPAPSAPRVRTL